MLKFCYLVLGDIIVASIYLLIRDYTPLGYDTTAFKWYKLEELFNLELTHTC